MSNTLNYLSPNSFKLVVPRAPNLEFHCASVSIPTVTVGEVNFATPQRNVVHFSDKLNFDALTVKMTVDENLLNYKEIFTWINELVYNTQLTYEESTEDLTLVVMSSHNNAVQNIRFTSAFPTTISGMEFNSSAAGVEYITADVEFRFTEMKFV